MEILVNSVVVMGCTPGIRRVSNHKVRIDVTNPAASQQFELNVDKHEQKGQEVRKSCTDVNCDYRGRLLHYNHTVAKLLVLTAQLPQ